MLFFGNPPSILTSCFVVAVLLKSIFWDQSIEMNNSLQLVSLLFCGIIASIPSSLKILPILFTNSTNCCARNIYDDIIHIDWIAHKFSIVTILTIFIPNIIMAIIRPRCTIVVGILTSQMLIFSHILLSKAISNRQNVRTVSTQCFELMLQLLNGAGFVIWFLWVISAITKTVLIIGIISHAIVFVAVLVSQNHKFVKYLRPICSPANDHSQPSDVIKKDHCVEIGPCLIYMSFLAANSLICYSNQSPTGRDIVHLIARLAILIALVVACASVLRERQLEKITGLSAIASDMNRGFVRFVSHELRSHLSHLTMGLEELLDDLPAKSAGLRRQRLMVMELRESLDMSMQILNDILIFDSLREQQYTPKTLLNVNRMIRKLIKELEPCLNLQGVDLSLDVNLDNHNSARLWVNETEMKQTLKYLLSNAIKASHSGETVKVHGCIVHSTERQTSRSFAASPPSLPSSLSPPPHVDGRVVLLKDEVAQRDVEGSLLGLLKLTITYARRGIAEEDLLNLFRDVSSVLSDNLMGGQASGLIFSISKALLEKNGGSLSVTSVAPSAQLECTIEIPIYSLLGERSPSTSLSHSRLSGQLLDRVAGWASSVRGRDHEASNPGRMSQESSSPSRMSSFSFSESGDEEEGGGSLKRGSRARGRGGDGVGFDRSSSPRPGLNHARSSRPGSFSFEPILASIDERLVSYCSGASASSGGADNGGVAADSGTGIGDGGGGGSGGGDADDLRNQSSFMVVVDAPVDSLDDEDLHLHLFHRLSHACRALQAFSVAIYVANDISRSRTLACLVAAAGKLTTELDNDPLSLLLSLSSSSFRPRNPDGARICFGSNQVVNQGNMAALCRYYDLHNADGVDGGHVDEEVKGAHDRRDWPQPSQLDQGHQQVTLRSTDASDACEENSTTVVTAAAATGVNAGEEARRWFVYIPIVDATDQVIAILEAVRTASDASSSTDFSRAEEGMLQELSFSIGPLVEERLQSMNLDGVKKHSTSIFRYKNRDNGDVSPHPQVLQPSISSNGSLSSLADDNTPLISNPGSQRVNNRNVFVGTESCKNHPSEQAEDSSFSTQVQLVSIPTLKTVDVTGAAAVKTGHGHTLLQGSEFSSVTVSDGSYEIRPAGSTNEFSLFPSQSLSDPSPGPAATLASLADSTKSVGSKPPGQLTEVLKFDPKVTKSTTISDSAANAGALSSTAGAPSTATVTDTKRDAVAVAGGSSKPKRFLVVDNVRSSRKMLRHLVEKQLQAIAVESPDGPDCMAKLAEAQAQSTPFDVVLLDFEIPNISGPVAAALIRSRGFRGKIVGVTGYPAVHATDAENIIGSGVSTVLSKPVRIQALREALQPATIGTKASLRVDGSALDAPVSSGHSEEETHNYVSALTQMIFKSKGLVLGSSGGAASASGGSGSARGMGSDAGESFELQLGNSLFGAMVFPRIRRSSLKVGVEDLNDNIKSSSGGSPAGHGPTATHNMDVGLVPVKTLKILIVDDVAIPRRFFKKYANGKMGHIVNEACDGSEAVREVFNAADCGEPYDAVFMDYSMPIMDGPTATRKLKSGGFLGTVIGFSGYSGFTNDQNQHHSPEMAKFLSSGVTMVLEKPMKEVELSIILAELQMDAARVRALSQRVQTQQQQQQQRRASRRVAPATSSDEDSGGNGHDMRRTADVGLQQSPQQHTRIEDHRSSKANPHLDDVAAAAAAATAAACATTSDVRGGVARVESDNRDNGNKCPSFHLLVVDDVSSNRKILTRLFEKLLHTTEEAEDGIMALKLFDEAKAGGRHFDAVFLDYVMPSMNGPKTAEALRKRGFTAPIFGVTGNVLQEDVDYFIKLGATSVSAKPLKKEMVQRLLSQIP